MLFGPLNSLDSKCMKLHTKKDILHELYTYDITHNFKF